MLNEFFGFPPVLYKSSLFTGHLLDLLVSRIASPGDGACVPWVVLERSWPGSGVDTGQVGATELWLGWQGGGSLSPGVPLRKHEALLPCFSLHLCLRDMGKT